jgi:DNA replication and repair protein RecF
VPINRLVVEDFRNLHSVDLRLATRINFIVGENGSGKTSILEVLYTLATGRSFRTRKFKNLIAYHSSSFQLFAEFSLADLAHRLGVMRHSDGDSLFKLDGSPVASAAELAALLPCQVIDSHSFDLLEGGPGERRAFIDWLVFHVKPTFRKVWGEYVRCLKHRNSLLRSDKMPRSEFSIWDKTLAELGEVIDGLRREVIEDFEPVSRSYLSQCNFVEQGQLEISYLPGWDSTRPLLDQLEERYLRDVAVGHTSLGPHKADIRFTFNKKPLAELFSRGQQKSVIAAFYLAQLNVFLAKRGDECILLLDDLPAEFDETNLHRVCDWISELQRVQTFITGIDLEAILRSWPTSVDNTTGDYKLFHVKQGQATEQPCQWSKP